MFWTKERPTPPVFVIGTPPPPPERLRVRAAWYAGIMLCSIAYVAYINHLERADLLVPLCPASNDSAALLSLVKCVQESGWPWKAERIGAPGVAERYDYPLPEHFHYLLLRGLLFATGNAFLAFNLWCLSSYPLAAACTFAVFRTLGISRPIGFALAMVYTFLPFHAGRAFTHTMLAHYHTVPLVLLPSIWITLGRLPFFGAADANGRRRFSPLNATTFWTLLLGIIVATTSPYYAFFGCYFLLIAGIYRSFADSSIRPLLAGLGTAGWIMAVGFACALPFMLEQREHGANPAVAQRNFNEADVYCLKITRLVLPTSAHRLPQLASLTKHYNTEELQRSENRDSVLGLIGVAGFVILLGRILKPKAEPTLIGGLAILNLAALLLGVSGGFGGLFNFFVFPQIRCYNRVCIFIAFFCLLAVGLLIDQWARRGTPRRVWWVAIGLLVFGLWDVTSQRSAPRHAELQTNHDAWAAFVERMENALPPGSMVFQLPAMSYPEAGSVDTMPDYAHLACHSYSKTLRWSYGTNRNRRWDEWHQHIARLTPEQMTRALALADFAGIYVDRRGFADNGKSLVADLRRVLGKEIAASDNGLQLLFSLEPAAKAVRETFEPAAREREKTRLLNRPCVLFQDGFYRWAPITPPEPRRAQYSSSLRFVNPGDEKRTVMLTMNWQRLTGDDIEMHIHSTTLNVDRREAVPKERKPFSIEIELPPGEHVLRFEGSPRPIGFAKMHPAWIASDISFTTRD